MKHKSLKDKIEHYVNNSEIRTYLTYISSQNRKKEAVKSLMSLYYRLRDDEKRSK